LGNTSGNWCLSRFAGAAMLLLAFSHIPGGLGQNNAKARNDAPGEYDVKGAFLLNFARFVEWPRTSERGASPLSICILGDDPFRDSLNRLVSGESIGSRPLVVKHLGKWSDACEILFIPASYPSQASLLAEIGPGVLTVGETPEFLRDGGIISFAVVGQRVRFDINRQAADRSGLRLSSRLLGVARTVLK
jgi:hypothetical protein